MIKVVGLRTVVSKKNGVEYREIHLNSENPYVDGYESYSVFVSSSSIEGNICLGSIIQLNYDRFGRVSSVYVVS